MSILEIADLRRAFDDPEGGRHEVVRVPHFELARGEQMAVHGESGSGKTTFLNLIAGILQADGGSIRIDGHELVGQREAQRDRIRGAAIGYIFQTFNLLGGYTALQNVELAMRFGRGVDHAAARRLLEQVGLGHRLHYKPRQLSVGQQQRVAVARALANHPALVLADEPTGNLDRAHADAALKVIRTLCAENGAALLLVSHDTDVLARFERVVEFSEINRPDGAVPRSAPPSHPSRDPEPDHGGSATGAATTSPPAEQRHPLADRPSASLDEPVSATPQARAGGSTQLEPLPPLPYGRGSVHAKPVPPLPLGRGSDRKGLVGGVAMMVRRSLRAHALSTCVTAAAAALACGLVMAVFGIQAQTEAAFLGGSPGFDAVLGARGSPLQLVLNTVYHLETSPGNIPWNWLERMRRDPRIVRAVPFALGDQYRSFRIVGTTEELFTPRNGRGPRFELLPGGRLFDPGRREAVIGSYAAQRTGLTVGSTFHPAHGVTAGGHEHEDEYVVVGVLRPTNTPNDRVIWIPIEGVFRMEGHVLRGAGEEFSAHDHAHDEIPDEHKEASAIVLTLRRPQDGLSLADEINRESREATLAWPIATVMADLFDKIGWVTRVLGLVAYLVVAVSAAAILASLYNTINERRREFAILRALGARRWTVFAVIVVESAAIAATGALMGLLVYAAILSGAAVVIRAQTGVVLDALSWHAALLLTPLGMIALGAAAGIAPAMKAYRTDVAENLAPRA